MFDVWRKWREFATPLRGDRAAGTKIRDSDERVRLQAEQFAALLTATSDAVCIVDATGKFVEVNEAFFRMTGYSRDELPKLQLQDILASGTSEASKRHFETVRTTGYGRYESQSQRKDGVVIDVEVSVAFWRNGGQFLFFVRDITKSKRAQEALRQSEERLTLATEAARMGIWDYNVAANTLLWDARMYELYGIREQDFSGAYDAWQAALHPDDRAGADAALKAAIAGVKDFDIEFRVVWPNGEVHDIEAQALVTGPANGPAARMIGVNWDITERKRTARQLAHSNIVLTAMTESSPEGMILADAAGKILSYNQRFLDMWHIPGDLAQPGIDDAVMRAGAVQIKDPEQFVARVVFLYAHPEIVDQAEIEFKDGRVFDRRTSSLHHTHGDYFGRIWFFLDITDRKKAEMALADSDLRLRTVMDTNVDGIGMMDLETRKVVFWNRAFQELLGRSADEMKEITLDDCHPRDALPDVGRAIDRQLRGETKVSPNLPVQRKDGSILFADVSASPIMIDGRKYMVGCFHDVTERKAAEEKLSAMARYDLLTGLANRHIFVDALDQAIARSRRGASSFSVLYLDLDHFKDVNDTLGHPVGDLLLQSVADRLRACVREVDTVARFGGDEFGILLSDIEDPIHVVAIADRITEVIGETFAIRQAGAAAGTVADKLLHRVSEPYAIQGNEIRTGTSIGIAVYEPNTADAETMLSHADVALYRAKSEGRGTYRFFDAAMEAEVRARVALGAELREAIASEQLFLVYQPQVELATGNIVGLEALVRWNHPTRGLVGPGQFIPEAERNGLIIPLGHWVMLEACRQAKQWLDAGIAPPLISVNLSAVQFKRPRELEKDIAAILAETGLPPQLLELELTESVLMEASAEHNDVLLRFRAARYRIAIDDFGSGYSSLDYLRRYPVDRIKIDQSFIAGIGQGAGNDAIVKAALGLAREMNIEVVVEGVETFAQLDLLKTWGCRIVQGFYFSRPVPVTEATKLLRHVKTAPPGGVAEIAPSAAA